MIKWPWAAFWLLPLLATAEEPRLDPSVPYRTDGANANLPWYQLQPATFPPHHSDHRAGGLLIAADYIHRSGVLRLNRTGELVDFKLPPFGSIMYLGTEADLRDVPLGTFYLFFLYQDPLGEFTQLATAQDEFTMIAGHGLVYHLDELNLAEGKMKVTKQKPSENQLDIDHRELAINEQTKVWKDGKQIKLEELMPGDYLQVTLTDTVSPNKGRCSEIYVGPEAQKAATEAEEKKHIDFLKNRGLPAWIDKVDGNKLTVSLLGADRPSMLALFKSENIDPARMVKEHSRVLVCVADSDLRTYNPNVDGSGSFVIEARQTSTDFYGTPGEQWVLDCGTMLEGFRKGRVVRIWAQGGWHVHDMPYGEGIYTEVPAEETRDLSPEQFPFRTDFAHPELPWYKLQPGKYPPFRSEHRVGGELVQADPVHRTGQFREDRTGKLVDFTMPAYGSVLYLNADADLSDLPPGTHLLFYLYPDAADAFTQAALIMDDFSYTAMNQVSHRVIAPPSGDGKLQLARKIALVKNDKDNMEQPPDIGAAEWEVSDQTHVWKGGGEAKLADVATGDDLLMDVTGRTKTSMGRATNLWIGAEVQKKATDEQKAKAFARLAELGQPGWIESIDGKKLTLNFFGPKRNDFAPFLRDEQNGKTVRVKKVDEQLQAQAGDGQEGKVNSRQPEKGTFGTYDCSGIRWEISVNELGDLHPGDVVRVVEVK